MANKFILGSGIVGMLAKVMLGREWTIIPFGRSRFFSYRPALDDNFIVRDEKIDDFIEHLGGKISFIYKTAYSLGGQLLQYNSELCNAWLGRIFGPDSPPRAPIYLRDHNIFTVYDIKINRLYEQLQSQYSGELKTEFEKGSVTAIGDRYIIRNNQKEEFDQIVSTIPLKALYKLMGTSNGKPIDYKQIWYYHVRTKGLDFEGANQTLVVDDYDFFKCANIADSRYMFYCMRDLQLPGTYFMQFMQEFDLIDGTTIEDALPCGDRPDADMKHLEDKGIFCVGSLAEHDYCADCGSNIMRLLKYKGYLNGGPKP